MSSFTSDRTNQLDERIILIFPDPAWEDLRLIAADINSEKTSAEVLLEMLARQVWAFFEDGSVYIVTRNITLQGEIVSLPRGDYGFQASLVTSTSQFTVTKAFRLGLKVESDWEIVTSQRGLPFPTTRGAFQLLESLVANGEEPPTIRPTDLSWPETSNPLLDIAATPANTENRISGFVDEIQETSALTKPTETVQTIEQSLVQPAELEQASISNTHIDDNPFIDMGSIINFDNFLPQGMDDKKTNPDVHDKQEINSDEMLVQTENLILSENESPFINIASEIDLSFLKPEAQVDSTEKVENQSNPAEPERLPDPVVAAYELGGNKANTIERPITAMEVPLPTQTEDAPEALVAAAEKSFGQMKQSTSEEKEEDKQSQIDLWIAMAKQQAQQSGEVSSSNTVDQVKPVDTVANKPVSEPVMVEYVPAPETESISEPDKSMDALNSEQSTFINSIPVPDYTPEVLIPVEEPIQEPAAVETLETPAFDSLPSGEIIETIASVEPINPIDEPVKPEVLVETAYVSMDVVPENTTNSFNDSTVIEAIPVENPDGQTSIETPISIESSVEIPVETAQHIELTNSTEAIADSTPSSSFEDLLDFAEPVEPEMNIENIPEMPVVKIANRTNDLDWWFSSEPNSDEGRELIDSSQSSTNLNEAKTAYDEEVAVDLTEAEPLTEAANNQNTQVKIDSVESIPNRLQHNLPLISERLESWGPDIFKRQRSWEMDASSTHGWEQLAQVTPLRLAWFFPNKAEAENKWEAIKALGTVRAVLFADDAVLSREDGTVSLRFRELWRERYRQSRVELESETTRLRILRSNIEQIEKSFQEYAGYQEELLRLGAKEVVTQVNPNTVPVTPSPYRQELINLLIQMQSMEEQLQKNVGSSRDMVDLIKSGYLKLQENYLRVLGLVAEKERYSAQPVIGNVQPSSSPAQAGNPTRERTRNNYNEQIRAIDRFLQDSYGQYFQNDPLWSCFTNKDIFGLSQSLVFRERALASRLKTLSNWQMLMESDAHLLEPQIWVGTCNNVQMFEAHNYFPHIIISSLDMDGNKRIEQLATNAWMTAKMAADQKWALSPGGIAPPDDPMLLHSVIIEQDENKNLAKVVWDERELSGERGVGHGV